MLEDHARLLSHVSPEADADLRRIAAESTADTWTRVSAAADARHAAEERVATRLQSAILLTTAALLVVLVRLAMLLRTAVRKQRQRTRLERAITKVSMDLVARYTPEAKECLADAVESLGKAFHADRALLVLQDKPAQKLGMVRQRVRGGRELAGAGVRTGALRVRPGKRPDPRARDSRPSGRPGARVVRRLRQRRLFRRGVAT